ncbi:galactose oxidase [Gigaspora margarita]|uniref:Galactose oxidase n=1 Tax=Gigaspora margarita TaxID=4874 RepID=A0A8H4B0C1_GIGMA|nr:galactose oxidase [Gigaspora margarita]
MCSNHLPYYFVISQNVPSPRCQQTSTLVGTRLYFFGGSNLTTFTSNEVWYLDLSSLFNISTPPWHSDVVMPVEYNFVVIDKNGKIFIFGGTNFISSEATPIANYYNDMNALDSTNMTWSTQTQSQSALTYVGYTATLLQNGLIVYIDGSSGSSTSVRLNDISQIQVFDTKFYTWSTKPISGSTIASRRYHSAVLTQDGNIIIYGGSIHDSSGKIVYVFSDIALLNTNSWVCATSASIPFANNIYILDIKDYTWVTAFNIPITTNPAKQIQNNSNSATDQANNNSSN